LEAQNHCFTLKITNTKNKKKNKNKTMAELLPILPPLKVTPKAVYVGDPDQLVRLLVSGVATAILEVKTSKSNQPVFKPKLRCKTLFQGNLFVYFLLDFPNIPLEYVDEPEAISVSMDRNSEKWDGVRDMERAIQYRNNLDLALSFWSSKMEEEVRKLYPDRLPQDVSRFSTSGLLELKLNPFIKEFAPMDFIQKCSEKKSFPCFTVSYGWILGTEDPRTKEQPWGFKFELSPYAQTVPVPRAKGAKEKQEELLKKRKLVAESEESA
jgi:hypothetical protein